MPEILREDEEYLRKLSDTNSRYRLTSIAIDSTIVPGRRRFTTWTKPDIIATEENSVRHVILPQEVGRPDIIAYKHYADVNLWWVICMVNDIKDPFLEMKSGDTVLIPDIALINEALLQS